MGRDAAAGMLADGLIPLPATVLAALPATSDAADAGDTVEAPVAAEALAVAEAPCTAEALVTAEAPTAPEALLTDEAPSAAEAPVAAEALVAAAPFFAAEAPIAAEAPVNAVAPGAVDTPDAEATRLVVATAALAALLAVLPGTALDAGRTLAATLEGGVALDAATVCAELAASTLVVDAGEAAATAAVDTVLWVDAAASAAAAPVADSDAGAATAAVRANTADASPGGTVACGTGTALAADSADGLERDDEAPAAPWPLAVDEGLLKASKIAVRLANGAEAGAGFATAGAKIKAGTCSTAPTRRRSRRPPIKARGLASNNWVATRSRVALSDVWVISEAISSSLAPAFTT